MLPKSALGQAAAYTLNMWMKLRRCFDYAEVELSNNLAENSMRPIALGRKNWLHVGSAPSGPKVAAILSVVESCRRLNLPITDCQRCAARDRSAPVIGGSKSNSGLMGCLPEMILPWIA